MDFDLVIQNGTLITADKTIQTNIGVKDGKIASLGSGLSGRENISAQGMWVIPGGVDPHVHLDMPTPTTVTSDDWDTGTKAAAYGGTTTVIDFVEPENDQTLLEALSLRRAQADGRTHIDYSLHMTLTNADPVTLAQIPAVMAAGIPSFKLYTTYTGFALPDESLLSAFEAVGAAGGLVMLHAENDAIVQHSLAKLRAEGRLAPQFQPQSRPALAEVEAIQRVILMARFTGVPLYIAHISTNKGSQAVERARNHGQIVYGETCPQYLLLDESHNQNPDPRESVKFICAPPLRKAKDQQALWLRLQNGGLQTVGTDHCAFNVNGQKDSGLENFERCPGGLPGIESRLALLHTFGVRAGWLTPQQWVSVCSAAPAQIFGLYPRKGSLEVGADADIVLFDPERRVKLTKSILHENVDYTPYEGLELQGWVHATFLRGQLVASVDESAAITKAKGQFVPVNWTPTTPVVGAQKSGDF
jgi:dihydropyrimidinase